MKQSTILEYAVIFIVVFGVACMATIKGTQYIQQKSLTNDPRVFAFAEKEATEETPKQKLNDPALLDLYTRHLVTINDPNKGCGCPACCGTV